MKAFIIDDEKHCVNTLEKLIKKYTDVSIVKSWSDPLKGLKEIKSFDADILFLDIEMPFINGFEFLAFFDSYNWMVIFTTAYDEYAVKAFKIHAIDYLLKPIDKEDLIAAIEHCKEKLDSKLFHRSHSDLKINFQSRLQKVVIPSLNGLELIAFEEILFLRSESNYTEMVLDKGNNIIIPKTLKYFQERLAHAGFLRVHNSFVVNINRIKRYVKGDGGYLVMDDGSNISVSRSKKEQLLKLLDNSNPDFEI